MEGGNIFNGNVRLRQGEKWKNFKRVQPETTTAAVQGGNIFNGKLIIPHGEKWKNFKRVQPATTTAAATGSGMAEAEEPATGDPYAEATAFTDTELQQLSNKLGIEYNLTDLENLENFDSLYGYVHTGTTESEYNSGITNHWLAIYGKYLLDSYGKYSAWDLPDWVVPVQTIPRALQAYDSNVCGLYCGAYLKHCHDQKNLKTNPGRSFSVDFGFTKDRKANDEIILDWYHSL